MRYTRVLIHQRASHHPGRMSTVASHQPELEAFHEAAIEWAAGARGQALVDAAVDALAAGLDTPTLRVLAGASRAAADEEAGELATRVFDELGFEVEGRLSEAAIVEGARLHAKRLLESGGSPRDLARKLWHMYIAAGYPSELTDWSGLDDWYDMLEAGVAEGRTEDVDAAVLASARALVAGTTRPAVPLDELFSSDHPSSVSRLRNAFRRRK